MYKVKKAVFPVAGLGTRFLPATKAMPKELLPIIDKPLVQYAVEEAVEAGIDTLIFVTGRNKRAIEDHFDRNIELERVLILKEQSEKLNMVRNILPEGVECIFVRQSEQLGLGHAILCAQRAVGKEPFAVLLADDFIVYEKHNPTEELIKTYRKTGKNQITVMPVDKSDISNYGVVKFNNNTNQIAGLIEKPSPENAPSKFASIGRYVLEPVIFEILKNTKPGVLGEIQLSDALSALAEKGKVDAVHLNGTRFDCGAVEGFLDAIIAMSKKRVLNGD